MIYKDLNLKELAQLAKVYPEHRAIVDISFKDKFTKSRFEILYTPFGAIATVSCGGRNIQIDFDTMLETFQLFGHLIQDLCINYNPLYKHTNKVRILHEYINKYLADSLTQIALQQVSDDRLIGLNGPFIKAVNVSLYSGRIESNVPNFAKIFPVVERLDFFGMDYVNPKTIEHHFPSLFHAKFEDGQDLNDTTSIERRLELNPQLKSIALEWASLDQLEVMSRNVQGLERLEVRYLVGLNDTNREEIRFNNLKSFDVHVSDLRGGVDKLPLVFGSLEQFYCAISMRYWRSVLTENPQIKKISTRILVSEDIEQIMNRCPNLEELSTGLLQNDSVEALRQFLNGATKLRKFSFSKSNSDADNTLIRQMANEWKVIQTRTEVILQRYWIFL